MTSFIKKTMIKELRSDPQRDWDSLTSPIVMGINAIDGIPVYTFLELCIVDEHAYISIHIRRDTGDVRSQSIEDMVEDDENELTVKGVWERADDDVKDYSLDELIDILEDVVDWDDKIWSVLKLKMGRHGYLI